MKQHTGIWQTKQLIELGFARPKSTSSMGQGYQIDAYSIGELISLLPKNIAMQREEEKWNVSIGDVSITKAELIDALFELLTH